MYFLVPIILERLERELETAVAASKEAHSSATHSENVADNKYGTLALEAAYLAHGQSVRIVELQRSILLYRHFQTPIFTTESTIELGALIDLEDPVGDRQRIFLGPAAGGLIIAEEPLAIKVVTAATPLGKLLLGKHIDEDFVLTVGTSTHHFSITNIQ